jgi:hypothetical protein
VLELEPQVVLELEVLVVLVVLELEVLVVLVVVVQVEDFVVELYFGDNQLQIAVVGYCYVP